MIIVDGNPISISVSKSPSQGREILASLLENPILINASARLKEVPERNFSISEHVKHVYVFQREYATVDPKHVQLVGTDEATTCVGLVIRNRNNGMTSVGHMDFSGVVDKGLTQMLQLVVDREATLDVHLIGGFDDVSTKHAIRLTGPEGHKKKEGYSFPLCCKIVEALQNSQEKFHLQTLCVLGHNTKIDSYGNARPIIGGFLVDTSSGLIMPANFDKSSRSPDEIVRRIRVSVSSDDPSWHGKLLETYDTHHDRFQIAPCSWMNNWGRIAFMLQKLSDSEILFKCSTSPSAEPLDFVESQRRIWSYLAKNPDWRQTFSGRKPHIFKRDNHGGWLKCV
ncbi:protein N-terminal asparagine amidohydrolase isoform X1 [Typha latifolia]|uniref:protein N-terminal asparagine amidohydrolase isoform X1 n=1 Tax=Typha latifolia TaxID=4733 RepID=UPI003C2EC74F